MMLGAMTNPGPWPLSATKVTPLHQHAEDNLRFIRASMESASRFTGISGKGYVLGGCTALAASWLAAQQSSAFLWLCVWMLELVLATCIMLSLTIYKTRLMGGDLLASASGRKLLLAFCPTMLAGGLLSFRFFETTSHASLPVIWLSLYGAAIMTAGALSIRAIPVMGAAFMLLGVLAAVSSINSDLLLGAGFGGLHILFGLYVWRQHGG
jgi:hypothetical protein